MGRFVAVLLLVACEDPAPAVCDVVRRDAPRIEVGEGDPGGPGLEPFEPGATLLLDDGPQGGYHVYLGVRAEGICPTRVVLSRTLRQAGDDLVHRSQVTRGHRLVEEGGAWVLAVTPQTFICPPTYADVPMHDAPFEVDMTLSEERAYAAPGEEPRSATATARFVPVCPEGDEVCLTDDIVGCDAWNGF